MKSQNRKAMYAKKHAQVKAIDDAINQWNERRQNNIKGAYGDPNSVEAVQMFRYANNQIKFLKKERDNIKGQMVLLE
jgi:hypothetical protein